MTNVQTIANPAIITTILLACVVGIAFMVLFFIALAREEKSIRPSYAIRARGVNRQAEIARAAALSGMPSVPRPTLRWESLESQQPSPPVADGRI